MLREIYKLYQLLTYVSVTGILLAVEMHLSPYNSIVGIKSYTELSLWKMIKNSVAFIETSENAVPLPSKAEIGLTRFDHSSKFRLRPWMIWA